MRRSPSTRNPALAVALALTALPAAAQAQSDRAELDGRRTQPGIIGNAKVGFGYTRLTSKPLTIQGSGAQVALSLGGMLTPELGFYGLFTDCSADAPSFYPNGAYKDDDVDVSVSITGIGAGSIYYFEPSDLYASLGVEMVMAKVSEMSRQEMQRDRFRSSPGVAGTLTFGRDWWVSSEWALGGAAQMQISYIPDQDNTTWFNGSFGLLFSATYN